MVLIISLTATYGRLVPRLTALVWLRTPSIGIEIGIGLSSRLRGPLDQACVIMGECGSLGPALASVSCLVTILSCMESPIPTGLPLPATAEIRPATPHDGPWTSPLRSVWLKCHILSTWCICLSGSGMTHNPSALGIAWPRTELLPRHTDFRDENTYRKLNILKPAPRPDNRVECLRGF